VSRAQRRKTLERKPKGRQLAEVLRTETWLDEKRRSRHLKKSIEYGNFDYVLFKSLFSADFSWSDFSRQEDVAVNRI
jgi:hypothetical protein